MGFNFVDWITSIEYHIEQSLKLMTQTNAGLTILTTIAIGVLSLLCYVSIKYPFSHHMPLRY